ncbi:MAG: hypothetical protein LQ348_006979 [Seirophora lacunosa]|nr:MAG: hypothetical protein LQ348_006979 [Seirophora lacunosa]
MTHLMRDFQDYVSQALGAINRRRVFHEAEPMVHPALADITYPSAPPPTPSNGPDDPFQGWDGWQGPRGPIENGPATVPSSTAVETTPSTALTPVIPPHRVPAVRPRNQPILRSRYTMTPARTTPAINSRFVRIPRDASYPVLPAYQSSPATYRGITPHSTGLSSILAEHGPPRTGYPVWHGAPMPGCPVWHAVPMTAYPVMPTHRPYPAVPAIQAVQATHAGAPPPPTIPRSVPVTATGHQVTLRHTAPRTPPRRQSAPSPASTPVMRATHPRTPSLPLSLTTPASSSAAATSASASAIVHGGSLGFTGRSTVSSGESTTAARHQASLGFAIPPTAPRRSSAPSPAFTETRRGIDDLHPTRTSTPSIPLMRQRTLSSPITLKIPPSSSLSTTKPNSKRKRAAPLDSDADGECSSSAESLQHPAPKRKRRSPFLHDSMSQAQSDEQGGFMGTE